MRKRSKQIIEENAGMLWRLLAVQKDESYKHLTLENQVRLENCIKHLQSTQIEVEASK